ncbi:hypothetical protein GCM10009119_28600 [Algoriphagus jejuensis]|uniref:Lipoprotein n=1 Tax=Algoriphagus jejuensis TaxID=419934 RepID=A0ABN1N2M9_9BACT
MRNRLFILLLTLVLSSCACEPEDIASFAFKGMETFMGAGFMPSEEIRATGRFQGMSVNLSSSSVDGEEESTIFLKLENGDPVALGHQPELLARKCAELYLRDFEKSGEYQKITVQFIQSDPSSPENIAMQEYMFDTKDFPP